MDDLQTVREAALLGEWAKFDHYMTRVEAVVSAARGLGNPSTAAQLMRLRRALARLNPTDPNGTPTESNSWDPTEALPKPWATSTRGHWPGHRGTTP